VTVKTFTNVKKKCLISNKCWCIELSTEKSWKRSIFQDLFHTKYYCSGDSKFWRR